MIDFKRRKDGIWARSRPSSTTPTAPPTSRCCCTRTARRPTSSGGRPKAGENVESGKGAVEHRASATPADREDAPRHVIHNVEMQPVTAASWAAPPAPVISRPRRRGASDPRCRPARCAGVRECRATNGTIGNADHMNMSLGKAGRKRHMGVRPQNRGTSMNPVGHPIGGGEGATRRQPPADATGKLTWAAAPARSGSRPNETSSAAAPRQEGLSR